MTRKDRIVAAISRPWGQIAIGAAVWALTVAGILRGAAPPGNDAYYHVGMARIMLRSGQWVVSDFPWTTCSIWSTPFFDKEWLFHVFLVPFVAVFGDLDGAKLATIAMVAAAAVGWGALLKTLGVKRIALCLLLALSVAGYAFPSRLELCRPHLASLFFIPLALNFAVRGWRWGTAVALCLYTLSYVGAWHIVPVIFLWDILRFRSRGTGDGPKFRPVSVWALAGLVAGLVASPYFPDNLKGIFVQTILVLKEKWFSAGNSPGLLVNELTPPHGLKLWLHIPLIGAMAATVAIAVEKRGKKIAPETALILVLASLYLVMTMFSQRFIEYSAPACAAALFLFWERHPASWWISARQGMRKAALVSAMALMAVATTTSVWALNRDLRAHRPRTPYLDAVAWIRDNTTPGDVVFSGDWGANAVLFHHLPELRFLVMLDPYFMKAYSARKHRLWWKVASGKTVNPAELIMREFDARIVFSPSCTPSLSRRLIEDPEAELVVKGSDGEMVFLLTPKGDGNRLK